MKKDTLLLHIARDPKQQYRAVNMPIIHASTIVFSSLQELEKDYQLRSSYGLHGVETHFCLLDSLVHLEQGYGGILLPSGLAAITTSLLAFLCHGDELLISDNCYAPTRQFADFELKRMGINTRYYSAGASMQEIKAMINSSTKVIFMECPGSDTFEMQDVPAIAEMARNNSIKTIMDNTWSAGYYFQPLNQGVDISIQALTKYPAGHSDCLLGVAICANKEDYECLQLTHKLIGIGFGSAEMAYLVTRGLRSMSVRLRQHQENAIQIAEWLESQPQVIRVLYPALPSNSGYKIWKRDFSGATSLFSVEIEKRSHHKLAALCNHMELFKIGYSWGGYESLLLPKNINIIRSSRWHSDSELLRLHIGLEDVKDLINDLDAAFKRYYS